MRAAILLEQNKPLFIGNIDIPPLDVGQVLVKVYFSGICGKQIDEIVGKQPDPYIPHLLGHEGGGIVVDVGLGITKVKKGDHVVLHWMKGSGINSSPPRFGKRISAGWVTTFSDYTIASENRVTKIADGIPFDIACLLGCAVTTGLGIVFNNANLMPGESICIFGAGGVGLNVIQGASLVNAYPITAIDIHQSKLDLARVMGATNFSIDNGQMFDVTVDTTGIPSVRERAYSMARRICVLAGVPRDDETITIDSYPLHSGRKIIGSHGGNTNPDTDIPRYLKLYELGKLKLQEQITHCYPLEKINEAIELVRKGGTGKCVIWMNDQ
jgi:S-(hydroxymethyl)glutathione dehydrogenase/alcohol dehydrogenase